MTNPTTPPASLPVRDMNARRIGVTWLPIESGAMMVWVGSSYMRNNPVWLVEFKETPDAPG